jgi:hypothetical protein
MASKKAVKSTRFRSRPRLTIQISPTLKRRIKAAAAAHDLTISAYITRMLEQNLSQPTTETTDGIVTSEMLERADTLRKQQKEPFPEDSADLIREAREERSTRL